MPKRATVPPRILVAQQAISAAVESCKAVGAARIDAVMAGRRVAPGRFFERYVDLAVTRIYGRKDERRA